MVISLENSLQKEKTIESSNEKSSAKVDQVINKEVYGSKDYESAVKKTASKNDDPFDEVRNAAQAEGKAASLLAPILCRLPNANFKSLGKFL